MKQNFFGTKFWYGMGKLIITPMTEQKQIELIGEWVMNEQKLIEDWEEKHETKLFWDEIGNEENGIRKIIVPIFRMDIKNEHKE